MFIHLLQLGRIPYADGLAIQARVIAARKAGAIGDTLLLLEHPPVITLGRNSSRANILASDVFPAARAGAHSAVRAKPIPVCAGVWTFGGQPQPAELAGDPGGSPDSTSTTGESA